MISFEVNYDGSWISIVPGQSITVDTGVGDLEIGIRVNYVNNTSKSCKVLIRGGGGSKSATKSLSFNETGWINGPSGVDIEFSLMKGCNTSGGPKKPVIIVPGFQNSTAPSG